MTEAREAQSLKGTSADSSCRAGKLRELSTSIPLPGRPILPTGLGSAPLSVTSVRPPTPNRLPLLQVLQGPVQTAIEHLSPSGDLFSFLPPVPPELLHTWVLLPAMLPLGFFPSFLCWSRSHSWAVTPLQPSQLPAGTSPTLPAAVHKRVALSRPCNSRMGGKVTSAVSFLAGQWAL